MEWNGRRLEEWKTIIFPYFHTKELINWKLCNVYFVPLQSCKQPLEKVPEQYRVYTVRENQGKTYLFRDGQGKSGKVGEFNEKVREIFLESSYLL